MNSEIAYLHLRSHRMFSNLAKDQLYRILDEMTLKRKRKGDLLDSSAPNSSYLHFILKGKVKVQNLNQDGHEITKGIIKDGDYFGDIVSPMNSAYEYGTVISDELVYFTLTTQHFEELSIEIPELALSLSKEVTLKLKGLENRYASLVDDDVQTRLIDFFNEWASEEGEKLGPEVSLKNYLTHNDIANLISTCRQTVTSILNRMKTKGNILYSRSKIVIPNIEKLQEIR